MSDGGFCHYCQKRPCRCGPVAAPDQPTCCGGTGWIAPGQHCPEHYRDPTGPTVDLADVQRKLKELNYEYEREERDLDDRRYKQYEALRQREDELLKIIGDPAPTPERVEELLRLCEVAPTSGHGWDEYRLRFTCSTAASLCRSWLEMRAEVERLKEAALGYGCGCLMSRTTLCENCTKRLVGLAAPSEEK